MTKRCPCAIVKKSTNPMKLFIALQLVRHTLVHLGVNTTTEIWPVYHWEDLYTDFRRDSLVRAAGLAAIVLLLTACGRGQQETALWTPVPTWTPTPQGANPPPPQPADAAAAEQPAVVDPQAVQPVVVAEAPTQTPTPLPPTPTDTPVPPTATPTETPTPEPTATATETPEPTPTPTPAYLFDLEAAEKFPTEGLAANVVRIYGYIYSPADLGLADYQLRVVRNGNELDVAETSVAGLPDQTRAEPGPYTRFTNFNVILVEPQAGEWSLQLIDPVGVPAGPPADFTLSADEITRELYVRYVLK